MTTEYKDLGEWMLAKLKASAAVTDLIVNGAAGVVEAGELNKGTEISDAQDARKRSLAEKALFAVVQDGGEGGATGDRTSSASVYIYDRDRGYHNIRAVREAIINAIVKQPVILTRGGYINQVHYVGRSGHQQTTDFDLELEQVNFAGFLSYDESGDSYA